MREDARALETATDAAMPIQTIRTPDQFIDALKRADILAEDPEMDEEFRLMAEAVRKAPFLIHCGRVVPKGFTPRIVR